MAELTVPQIDFSTIGDLPKIAREAQVQRARQMALSDLGSGGDYQATARALLAAGDLQGGLTLAQLGNNERDFAFRNSEIARNQSNSDREFNLRRETANTATIQTVKDANGNETLVRIDRQGNATPINTGPAGAPTNPFSYGKQNENQSKDSGYANRMFRAEGVLRDPKVEEAATSIWENTKGMLPGFAANYATSPDYQRFDQAKRDFVNAVLRRESGAAISQSEFDNANKQYFPQPGDSKEKIAEKRKNRQDAIAGVAGGGGPSYRPPFVFDEQGNMVASGNPKQGVSPQSGNAPVKVTSPAERDALPSGTQYIAPDGSLRTKQ